MMIGPVRPRRRRPGNLCYSGCRVRDSESCDSDFPGRADSEVALSDRDMSLSNPMISSVTPPRGWPGHWHCDS